MKRSAPVIVRDGHRLPERCWIADRTTSAKRSIIVWTAATGMSVCACGAAHRCPGWSDGKPLAPRSPPPRVGIFSPRARKAYVRRAGRARRSTRHPSARPADSSADGSKKENPSCRPRSASITASLGFRRFTRFHCVESSAMGCTLEIARARASTNQGPRAES
jgi:hypothetical protein